MLKDFAHNSMSFTWRHFDLYCQDDDCRGRDLRCVLAALPRVLPGRPPPPHILNETFVQPTYLIIYWLAMSNACYNPFIYCWMNSRIQECVPLLHVEGRKDQPSGTKKVYCCPPKYGEWNYGSSNGDRVPEFKQSSDLQQICAP
ncbi:hypothetical protein CDAR_394431 [Caerostris darwini]|uniref:G-protein coupled receptors family 1 profile domain-containing protein n=1 Tax=Caerostris darwini TaxID=1538125 RepID=A0AAV4MBX4_9ARAC|nr:hypothetical protein CDAR_394431 [Caerostris darwini]